MSISAAILAEINRIKTKRNIISAKLEEMGLVTDASDANIDSCATAVNAIPIHADSSSGLTTDDAGTYMDIDVSVGYHKSYGTYRVDYPESDSSELEAQVAALQQEIADIETELKTL